ncbi:MAG: alpha-L-rhamnosidase [Actinoallomurus sp.]|nr:alpha-L-rhamnosidase [Actinoallomurus sp.]
MRLVPKFRQAPSSRHVRPVRVVSATGDVTNPRGLLGRGTATLSRQAPAPKPTWPSGTTDTASSYHAPHNGNNGRPTTYVPGNAIDGKVAWSGTGAPAYQATDKDGYVTPHDIPAGSHTVTVTVLGR